MAIENILLEMVDDNPFNPRKHYPREKVYEMANSLREVGLRQVPEGRRIDGKVQLAYGHMRLRGFLQNQKKEPEKWKTMPVDVKEISDREMFDYAMEENLRRTDITPIELARCVQAFSEMFPEVQEKDIGAKHSMSEANVSNMKRVLRLPQKFLDKIDEGIISFTQGRELLTLEGLPNAENLMEAALSGLKIGNRNWGEPNTVEGLQKSIHSVIKDHFPPIDKEFTGYRYDLVFDTRTAGCLQCEKVIRTHPTKSQVARFCSDEACWQTKQAEHREQAAAAAKAKMQAEVIQRAAQVIAEAPPAEKEIAVLIDENAILVDQETFLKIEDSYSGDRISEGTAVRKPVEFEGKLYVCTGSSAREVKAYVLVPRAEYKGEVRTYKVPAGRESGEYYESLRNDPNGFYHGMLVKRGQQECVLVGPEATFVTKVDKGDFSQEKLPAERDLEVMAEGLEAIADERDRQMEEARERANLERPVGEIPCETCAKGKTCDRSFFGVADDDSGRFVCDQWECDHVSWAKPAVPTEVSKEVPTQVTTEVATQEIPDEVLQKAKEAAGSRAEVLDLNEVCTGGGYYRQVKQGYALLSDELRHVDEPEECLERCTHGFHYGFDSKAREQKEIFICSDTKCLAKKKGALTRKRNAAGQARKNAEREAIKQVLDLVGQVAEKKAEASTVAITRPVLTLIIYNQLHGKQIAKYYYGDGAKTPNNWLWDRLSAGTAKEKRDEPALWKLIRKLSDVDLVKLVVEMMFYFLTDTGDVASYEIKTREPLELFGVVVNDVIAGTEAANADV